MKHRICGVLVATQLLGTWVGVAQPQERKGPAVALTTSTANARGATSNPAIAISPRTLDFGSIITGSTRTLSFTIQNTGGGLLSGAAEVSEPFTIVGDNTYMLRSSESKIITVRYSAETTGVHLAVVRLSGAGNASITLTASATPPAPKPPVRPRGPASSPNLRLIAGS